MIKSMVYTEKRHEPKQLVCNEYKGYKYYILSLGTHPCAYVDVSSTKLNGVEYGNIEIFCHGGLTYSRKYLCTVEYQGWFIGWDYAHFGDFFGADSIFWSPNAKKWTTEEIIEECKDVIEQIIELEKITNERKD